MVRLKTYSAATESATRDPFQYQIRRSARRRTISIEVRAGEVVVRSPVSVSERELHQFVQQKAVWIVHKIAEQKRQLANIPSRFYGNGGELPFLGRKLVIVVSHDVQARCELAGQELLVCLSQRSRLPEAEQIRRLVCAWYQRQALVILTTRTLALSAQMGLVCTAVTIKATRSKWGHCTSKGAIQYNWQIVLAPEAIVDYLVAHEVSHLQHHNHSPLFWQLVASVCPTFYADRAWLKAHGGQLIL